MVLIAFSLSFCGHVSTDKKEKNIAIIFNPSNLSSDFYFCHFVEIEDIPQSCMLIFFS